MSYTDEEEVEDDEPVEPLQDFKGLTIDAEFVSSDTLEGLEEALRQAEERTVNPIFEKDSDFGDNLRKLLKLYNQRAKIRAAEKELTNQYNTLNRQMADYFVDRRIQNHRLEEMGLFYKTSKIHAAVAPEAYDQFNEELDKMGEGAISTRRVHPSRLTSWVRNRLEEGLPIPEEITTFTTDVIGIRRDKKGKLFNG